MNTSDLSVENKNFDRLERTVMILLFYGSAFQTFFRHETQILDLAAAHMLYIIEKLLQHLDQAFHKLFIKAWNFCGTI